MGCALAALAGCRGLIGDRERKGNRPVQQLVDDLGIRIVQTAFQAPVANAYAERFVRSISEARVNRVIPF